MFAKDPWADFIARHAKVAMLTTGISANASCAETKSLVSDEKLVKISAIV
jgi:hypothetical protein